MKNSYLFRLAALLLAGTLSAQAQTGGVRIGTAGTPAASAVLDLSPDAANAPKGLLPPRLTQAQRNAIGSPIAGLVVYQTDITPGLYVYTGTAWVLQGDDLGNHTATQNLNLGNNTLVGGGGSLGLSINNKGRLTTDSNLIVSSEVALDATQVSNGTLNGGLRLGGMLSGEGLASKRTSGGNQFGLDFYTSSLNRLSISGAGNVGIGTTTPGQLLDVAGTTRTTNAVVTTALTGSGADLGTVVGVGVRADGGLNLGQNTSGKNVLLGYQAGQNLTQNPTPGMNGNSVLGSFNQFIGYQSGYNTTTGYQNVFSGYQSGYSNTTGYQNVFSGYFSGLYNTTGRSNVFIGYLSGTSNTTGSGNTFSGVTCGHSNTTGIGNVFTGYDSGYGNTTGNNNVFSGYQSGYRSTTSDFNVFIGFLGGYFNTTGTNNTVVGSNSGPDNNSGSISNATALGANVKLTQSNTVILGKGASVGIGTTTPGQLLDVNGNTNVSGDIYVGGNVGIGTSAPIAKLHVSGGVTNNFANTGNISYMVASGFTANQASPAQTRTVCAYFEGGNVFVDNAVHAGQLSVSSDARIKHIVGRSSGGADLALLQRLRITDYTYLDVLAHGSQVTKKVIAQEVEEVLPAAVSRSTQALPNVYARATAVVFANGTITLTCPTPHGLPAGGGRLRLFTAANEALSPEVTVVDAHTVRFAAAQPFPEGLFVYGRFVEDFRSVDYDALTTLTVSATQELARKVAALEQQNAALKTQVAGQQASLGSFEQRLRALEAGGEQAHN